MTLQVQAERWSPWLDRLLERLGVGAGWLMCADAGSGALWLLDRLLARDPDAVALPLAPDDPHGTTAARALAHALARRHGLPEGSEETATLAQLAVRLASEHAALRPTAVYLLRVEHLPDAVALLDPLARVGVRVGAWQERGDGPALDHPNVVTTDLLALTPAEAARLARGFPVEPEPLRRAVDGRIEAFLDALAPHGFTFRPALAFLPPELRPGGVAWPPRERIRLLAQRGAAICAFELAVRDDPASAAELVRTAGPAYLDRGLAPRLLDALAHLPPDLLHDGDDLVRFGLEAALVCGQGSAWRPRVERVLAERVAPEVRALHAHAFLPPDRSERTALALAARETPVTLRMHAFAVGMDGDDGWHDLLVRALKAAEALGESSQIVAAASDLANLHVRAGDYHGGIVWATRALEEWDRRGPCDPLRRLTALSIRLYAGILTAEDADLPALATFARELAADADAGVPTGDGVVGSLGDHAFAAGRFDEAEAYYRRVWLETQPEVRCHAAPELAMVLLRLARPGEAVALAREALALTRSADPASRAVADFTFALAIGDDPERRAEATRLAASAYAAFTEPGGLPYRRAQAAILLARLHAAAGEGVAAAAALRRAEPVLRDLGTVGWRFFGGAHPTTPDVRALARSDTPDLQLRFFGTPSAHLRGVPVPLTPKEAECLCVLALHPHGMTAEQLTEALYGESGSLGTTKSRVSRLRDNALPIVARPYRFEVSYDSDLGRAQESLRRGDAASAVALVTGPLLPASVAPAIESLREEFAEALRRGVLASGDSRLANDYLRRIAPDDLEVVEWALARLPDGHPEAASLQAREGALRRDLGLD